VTAGAILTVEAVTLVLERSCSSGYMMLERSCIHKGILQWAERRLHNKKLMLSLFHEI
jgi:hypothetical protein